MKLKKGEIMCLLGDNGAGKSTLVKILAGVHQASSGAIEFQGKSESLATPRAALKLGIATVFQDLALCENLDVVSNIFLGQELKPFQLDEVSMEVKAWTLLNELSARIPNVRSVVASLSGGQRQTVAIARSLLLDPKIIILDEPTAALGPNETEKVERVVNEVNSKFGTSFILVSHNIEQVKRLSSVVLRLGKNNGIFTSKSSNQELVGAITGASENVVTKREKRLKNQSNSTREK